MKMKWQSNALWPEDVYMGSKGDSISTDAHYTKRAAENVCEMLEAEGFGLRGEDFPIRTWVSEVKTESDNFVKFTNPTKGYFDLGWYVSGVNTEQVKYYLHSDGSVHEYCSSDDYPESTGWFSSLKDAYDVATEYYTKHNIIYPYTLIINADDVAVECADLSGKLIPNKDSSVENIRMLEAMIHEQAEEISRLKEHLDEVEQNMILLLKAAQKDISEIVDKVGKKYVR